MSLDLPECNDPFYRESLRPLIPTAQQLCDPRFHPSVEAVRLNRLGSDKVAPQIPVPPLPREGSIRVPVILGQPGDPNRHGRRPVPTEKRDDEYVDFRQYSEAYFELQLRIQQIRERSALYPVWAGDKPVVPMSIGRKFADLNQQLFALKKCFVSPEEIMLDNTAMVIQRFWRSIIRRDIYRKASKSIRSYTIREMSAAHRSLNAWVAQMEYADSRGQQLCFRSIARLSKTAVRFWVKWAEKESVHTNRNGQRALEQLNKNCDRRHRRILQTWRDIATGPRSWKALKEWRQSMIPVMKWELESHQQPVPLAYIDLVSAYVAIRARRSFLFNCFLAWHEKFHTKSLKDTVKERNAVVFCKRRLTLWSFKEWSTHVRKTKAFLGTPERWAQYIQLSRTRHQAKMAQVAVIVRKWHQHARNQTVLKERRLFCRRKMLVASFHGWRTTVNQQRNLKLAAIFVWKKKIQNPNLALYRGWRIWAIRKRARHEMAQMLDHSHSTWRERGMLERTFGLWQRKFRELENQRADLTLQRSHWKLQESKQNTGFLSGLYSRDREKIQGIETDLGDVTVRFVGSENEVSVLEELTTTWKIALHAMKMELMRIAIAVQRCATAKPLRRRRLSNEDCRDRLANDDRYAQKTSSRMTLMRTGDRVIGKWIRRNSDPDLNQDLSLVSVKPPLDENIIHLLTLDPAS
jgi:hypothetical protein